MDVPFIPMAEPYEDWILCKVIIEVVGKPKEHIENSLRMVIDRLKHEEKNIKLKQGDLFKAKEVEITTEQKGQFWSTFAELDIYVKNVQVLSAFCFEYMPSSIEILEPQDLKFGLKAFSDVLTDLMTKLHNVGMAIKTLKAENDVLNRNAASLLRNIVMIALRTKEKSADEVAAFSGIEKEKLKPFLDEFVKGGLLIENNCKYALKK
jgi:hypothetical protein